MSDKPAIGDDSATANRTVVEISLPELCHLLHVPASFCATLHAKFGYKLA
jgi:hypothetical protein